MWLGRLGRGAVALVLATAAYWSARLAYADHLAASESVRNLRRAVELAPENARYALRWADLMEAAGEHPDEAITQALAANPQEASVWMRAGLQAEMRGDYPRAEQYFLEAAARNRQYDTRWTLANFYFRRGNSAEFWKWTRSAAEWMYGDPTPLFQLAWAMSNDAEWIGRHAIPENEKALRAYLGFVLGTNRLDAAESAARRLTKLAGEESVPTLLSYVSRMIDVRRPGAGLATWNELCTRRLLPYEPATAGSGKLPTNGDFRRPPLDMGFDWRIPQIGGVATVRSEKPVFLRFTFSGKQPERCAVLDQFLPVVPAAEYRLKFEYQTTGIQPRTGLRWRVYDGELGQEIATDSPQLASDEWTRGGISFTTPLTMRWIRLALEYERMPGTTRIEGAVSLRGVALNGG